MNMKKMTYGITRNMQMYQNTTHQSIDQGYSQHEYLVTHVLYNQRSMQLTDSHYTWNTSHANCKSNSDIGDEILVVTIQSTKISCMDMDGIK